MLVADRSTKVKTEKGNASTQERSVFFISDRTGITAEVLGSSLLTQFDNISFNKVTMPFVDTQEKAINAVHAINEAHAKNQLRPIVFATIIDDNIREALQNSTGFMLDFFNTFIGPLEFVLEQKSTHTVGLSHAIKDGSHYSAKIEALNFALAYDDGINTNSYTKADLILTGVSRSGKTPTSIYLAMQYGIKVANYPLVDEDLDKDTLPECLIKHKEKLIGLSISPETLTQVRQERMPNTKYASIETCSNEVSLAESLFNHYQLKVIDATNHSVEEIATKIMLATGLPRKID